MRSASVLHVKACGHSVSGSGMTAYAARAQEHHTQSVGSPSPRARLLTDFSGARLFPRRRRWRR